MGTGRIGQSSLRTLIEIRSSIWSDV